METLNTTPQPNPLTSPPVSPVVIDPIPEAAGEESLVADARASLTPAQMVERKLVSLLRSNPLPVSHLTTEARTSRGR